MKYTMIYGTGLAGIAVLSKMNDSTTMDYKKTNGGGVVIY